MRKFYLVLITVLFAVSVHAQNVAVTGADAGTNAGSPYATLAAAFTAINGASQTGNVIAITIIGNTSEPAGGAILNAGTWTSMSIQPAGGAARTIQGTATAGSPLIDFNGADNVTVDGLNAGGNSLTISNLSTSSTSGTSTIRFQGDATSNTITNCSVLGSATMANGTNGGNIWFGSAAISTGNDNNTISNCNIGPAGANLPSKCIYFSGSSNSDPGTANSGIIINNNNIFDFFSATVSSSGVDLNSGTVGTTISNNRFYQTATRTQTTTGLSHRPININNSSGNAYQVIGNTIGFASNTGTGTYTFVFPSTTSGSFIPIFLAVNTITASSVQGNTIAGIAISGGASGTSTSAPFRGIYVSTGLTTIGDITGNIIGSQSVTGSITYTSSSTSASDVIGMFNFGSSNWTTNNNAIGGFTVSNSSTGATNFYGLRANTSSSVTWICNNNLIGGPVANSINSTSTAVGTIVNGILNLSPAMTVTANVIRNMTVAGGTGTTTSASMVGICMNASSANHSISQNTIFNLSNSNTTAATVVTGIQFTGSTANIIERNFIHSLTSATNSTSAEINGIRIAGGTNIYRNNMIALGAGVTNAIGSAASNSGVSGINGINEALGTNTILHNSIYIGGSPTAGTGASYAFNGTQTTNTRSFRDNIFFNARSNAGATGKNYAVKINGTVANPTGLTINNNVYFANGTGGVFGFFNSLDVAGLAAWKAAVGQDVSSLESNPQYVDPTNATPNLHIAPATPTVVEGQGFDLGVVDDFDGQTRSGLTPVDIGADAGNFLLLDVLAPIVTYTPFTNTACLTDRTLSPVPITDAGGVNITAGTRPRLYYKRAAHANNFVDNTNLSNGWKFVEATGGGGSPFSFTTNFSLMPGGPLTAGDVIQYFVVAEDNAGTPNVSINNGTFAATPTSVALTPAAFPISGTINSFTVVAPGLSGAMNVGPLETTTSLTNAGGLFEQINTSGLNGNLAVTITGNITGELGTNALNAINYTGCSGGPFTLIIKPNGAYSITGTNSGGLIRLNGADNVTIDGSISATPNTLCPPSVPSRDLTITNTNTGTSSAVIWLQSAGSDGATNNTIKNCNIAGNGNTQTLFGIGSGSSTISTSSLGTGNNNNNFFNNNISKTQFGIFSQGASAGNKNTGNFMMQNLINTVAPNNVSKGGILVGFENNIAIIGNQISEIAQNGSPDVFGISLGHTGITTSTFTGNEVTNATVYSNKIGSIRNTGTFSAAGISVAPATSGTNLIANNMISGVSANGTSGDFSVGILIGGGAGSTTMVYHNTVTMTSVPANGGASDKSYALAIGGSNPVVDIRNNILVNTQNNGTGNNYAIGYGYSTFSNLTSNNNNYYVPAGATFFIGGTGSISSPTTQLTVGNLQTATGKDGSAQNILPLFLSATDLHADNTDAGTLAFINAKADNTVLVAQDIDCQARSGASPDIGADEFTAPPCSGAVGGTATGDATFCGSGTPTITATGYSTAAGYNYQWMSSTVIGNYPAAGTPVGGQTNPAALTTGVVSTTTYYWLRVTCTDDLAVAYTNMITVTVNPAPATTATPLNQAVCSGSGTSIVFSSGTPGATFAWTRTNTVNVTGLPANGAGDVNGILTNGTAAPQLVTFQVIATANGCPGPATNATVTVNPLPTVTSVITQPSSCVAADGAIDVTVAGTPGPYSYSWTTLGGFGLVPGVQDQTNLTAANYNVEVTDANGCKKTLPNSLTIGGLCATACPIIGNLSTNPTPVICAGGNVILTASGLVDMGVTYGIQFVYSTSALPDPYSGGTPIGTVPNGSLTGGGTVASLTTSFAVPNSYYIYAILSPAPVDAGCRPFKTFTLGVNPLLNGDINGLGQSICATQGASIPVSLQGVPNFTGHFTISVLNGVGLATPDFAWTSTVSGLTAVTIPAASLPNTTNGITTYRVAWMHPTTALTDAAGCPVASPLTGFVDIVVYPTPDISATLNNAPGDICPGSTISFTVSNPNGVPGALYNWEARDNNGTGAILGSANNVAFGALNTTLGITCPITHVNGIRFRFTPVGPNPRNCPGTPVDITVNVRDITPPALTGGNGNATLECSDAAGIAAARAFVPVFTNTNCSGAPVLDNPIEVYTPSCGYSAPYAAGKTGTLVTTWIATEPCGSTSTVTQTITIVDTQVPTWTTAVASLNTTINCGNNAAAFAAQLAAAQAMVPVATDACTPSGQLNATLKKTDGVFAPVGGPCVTAGSYTNTFTVSDACGNFSAVFMQTITIVDNTAPTLGNPGTQTLNVGAGPACTATLPDYRPLVSYTDCTPISGTLVQSPAPGTTVVAAVGPGPVGGSVTVQVSAQDACGNSSTISFLVNLTDATPPDARCHKITVNLNAAGTVDVVPADIDGNGIAPTFNPKSSDNCGLATFNSGLTFQAPHGLAPNSNILRRYTCANLGDNPITLVVTDLSGNISTCNTVVTVQDVTPPVITCAPAQTFQKNATCITILPSLVGVGQTTATDACGVASITQIPAAGSIIAADVASLNVQFIATDGSGNQSTCTTTILFRDQTPPVITGCPAPITVFTGAGNTDCQVTVIWTPPTATDNCSPILGNTTLVSTHQPAGPVTINSPNGGLINIPAGQPGATSGNAGPYPSTISVSGIPPGSTVQSVTLNGINHTFPTDIDIVLVSPLGTAVSLMSDVGSSAGMTGETITLRDGFPAMSTAGLNPTGTYSPTNSGTGDTYPAPGPGTMNDVSPALATFGNGNHNGTWSLFVVDDFTFDSGFMNNWSITFANPSVGGTPFFVGTTTVTYTATDAAGNTAVCSFPVTVIDNTLPTITCNSPGNKTVNATASCQYTHSGTTWDATGTDNCIPVLSATYTLTGATTGTGTSLNGRAFNLGTTTVTWRVVDQSTNSATCSFTVTVVDTQVPSLTCPANVAINSNTANCAAVVPVASLTPIFSDNCAVTLVEWSVSGATPISSGIGSMGNYTFSLGTSLVTFRVSDAAGNSTLCTFNVVVTNALSGSISGTAQAAQNAATTSTITFTGSGAPATPTTTYTFGYNLNGGPTQFVTTGAGSTTVTVAQSNAVIGTYVYTLVSVSANNMAGCAGAITPPNTATITVVAGQPDLTNSQFFSTTQIAAGGTIEEVVSIRNVGTAATFGPIVFTVTNYAAITGLSAVSNTNPTVTIGFTTYTLDNANWTITTSPSALTFTSNAGIFINPGQTRFIGVRIQRAAGANGTVTHSSTITGGTGGGETPTNNNSISNTLLKN